MEKKLSAATKRMMNYYQGDDFVGDFRYSPAYGLGKEKGINRRDPTSVIYVDGLYHVWYTRSCGESFGYDCGNEYAKVWPWDLAEIWHATSKDGVFWDEKEVAVKRGKTGEYDDRSVFTPEILQYEGKYYLVYQVVQHPYLRGSFESIAIAVSNSPDGPWIKSKEPILKPSMPEGRKVDIYNPLNNEPTGLFDDLRVHDPCLFVREGKIWLYYKGEHVAERMNLGGRDIRWGVAIADKPEGPYERSPYNPVTNTGHETCLWHYQNGMVALLTHDGPECNTIQYAEDGVNFEIKAYVQNPPHGAGPFRTCECDSSPLAGFRWGLCHDAHCNIIRFDTTRNAVIKRNVLKHFN